MIFHNFHKSIANTYTTDNAGYIPQQNFAVITAGNDDNSNIGYDFVTGPRDCCNMRICC